MDDQARDVNGTVVRVGTRVRVLKISASVLSQLPRSEAECARSMEGEIFEVYEIDDATIEAGLGHLAARHV